MKKEERLHRLFGDIDDELVADAARKPMHKTTWIPLVAAAACVALVVGLWPGGTFSPAAVPVEPDEGTSTTESIVESTTTVNSTTGTSATTENPTEPSKTDPTKTTEPSKTETTTAKPTQPSKTKTTTKTESTKTTVSSKTETTKTTTEPYILVGGEDNSNLLSGDRVFSLKDRLVSQTLEEKMEEYRDVNAVFRVGVFWVYTCEDEDEFGNFCKADEEYQAIYKQYLECATADERKEIRDNYLSPCRSKLWGKYTDMLEKERISYAAKFSKTEPIIGYGPHGNGYYMELTADAINELANRGGYLFMLASEKIDLSKPVED